MTRFASCARTLVSSFQRYPLLYVNRNSFRVLLPIPLIFTRTFAATWFRRFRSVRVRTLTVCRVPGKRVAVTPEDQSKNVRPTVARSISLKNYARHDAAASLSAVRERRCEKRRCFSTRKFVTSAYRQRAYTKRNSTRTLS